MLIVMWLGYVLRHISSTFINYIQKLSYLDSIAILGDWSSVRSLPASETKKSRFRNQNVRFRNQNDSETKMTDSATKTEAFQNQNVPVQKQKKRNSETKTYDSETKI